MILDHLAEHNLTSDNLSRMWLHQANINMNDFLGKKIMGRTPEPSEQPNILQKYANTSSAGSIIAFHQNKLDLNIGDIGILCAFGAGYSAGNMILKNIINPATENPHLELAKALYCAIY